LYPCIRRKCESLRVLVLALNGMPDHVHLACSLPTHLAVADFIEAIKGSSAHYLNHEPNSQDRLYWQGGYGVLTFSRRDLSVVVRYIDEQKTHHSTNQLSVAMEQCFSP
jgi:putative transposase